MDYPILEQYWIWLSGVPGLTPRKFYALLTVSGDARAIWDDVTIARPHLDEKTYAALVAHRSERAFYQGFAQLEKCGATAVTRVSDLYPASLANIVDAPPTLYIQGNPDLRDERAFAIVGTRGPSYDGKRAAKEFAEALASSGVTVVSGLARGIDTCAHAACVSCGARTVAVLGSGLLCVYPPENAGLAHKIIETGGSIVSEMQLNDKPQKWSFPARNRIISGLCSGVLVVEGKNTSGAMITADCAAEQSREVFAIPGSIYAPLSEGPNRLIQSGAFPALHPWDILEALRWGTRPSDSARKKQTVDVSEDEKKILDILKIEALSFDEISYRTGFSASALNSHLTMLILRGIIIKAPGNYYRASE